MAEYEVRTSHLCAAAGVLETRFEEIFATYEERLLTMSNSLVAEAETREHLRAHAYSVLEEVAATLRGREAPSTQQKDPLPETIGVLMARKGVHPSESLRDVVALSEAALPVVVDNLPPSPTSRSEVAAVALAIQKSILERVARTTVAYSTYLLEKVHESHADERRRISRELHDRAAHSIMVSFRSLELYEMHRTKDPSKAQIKLGLAKSTTQEALELTRSLSRELRTTSAEEGLKVALPKLLNISVPQDIRSWATVRGDESLMAPQMRDELFLVLREGVRNAATYSGASTIKVKVDIAEGHVKAAVEDDGRGFEPREEATRTDGGTGITSMKERATLLGGTLLLMSAPGKGTRVEILLPLPRSRR